MWYNTSNELEIMRRYKDTLYFVSEDGIVISKYPVGGDNRFKKGRPSNNHERIIGNACDSYGYKEVRTRKLGRFKVHQMVMWCYGPQSPGDGYVIDHIDENKLNNHISNLRWLLRGENVSRSHRQRMYSDEFEQQIRDEYIPRVVSRQMLCDKYNIKLGTLKGILKRTR